MKGRFDRFDLSTILGISAISTGLSMIYLPLAPIFIGLLLLVYGLRGQ